MIKDPFGKNGLGKSIVLLQFWLVNDQQRGKRATS
jgi:hypothetical protein